MKNNQKSDQKITIQPLGDRVLVRPKGVDEATEKTKSGIFIPDTVEKEKSEEGTVIAVGQGRYEDGKLVPLQVNVGDKVLFSKYGYEEVKVDGKEYFILKEESVLAVIK